MTLFFYDHAKAENAIRDRIAFWKERREKYLERREKYEKLATDALDYICAAEDDLLKLQRKPRGCASVFYDTRRSLGLKCDREPNHRHEHRHRDGTYLKFWTDEEL